MKRPVRASSEEYMGASSQENWLPLLWPHNAVIGGLFQFRRLQVARNGTKPEAAGYGWEVPCGGPREYTTTILRCREGG